MPNLQETITDVFDESNDFKNDYGSMHGSGFSIALYLLSQLGLDTITRIKKLKTFISLPQGHILGPEYLVYYLLLKW